MVYHDWYSKLEYKSVKWVKEKKKELQRSMSNHIRHRGAEPDAAFKGHGQKRKHRDRKVITKKLDFRVSAYNQKISAYIVNQAVNWKCERIKMIDLTKVENTALGSWSYFDIQTKVKQKAQDHLISVELVDPAILDTAKQELKLTAAAS